MSKLAMSKCIECGESEDAHHAFLPYEGPPGCVCFDDESWGAPTDIRAICSAFVVDPDQPGYCKNCSHDPECHAAAEGTPPGGTP